jgi:hypothetical protein
MSLRTLLVTAAFAAALFFPRAVHAGADDYAFEPVQSEVDKGDGVTISVRLIEKATNKTCSRCGDHSNTHRHGASQYADNACAHRFSAGR